MCQSPASYTAAALAPASGRRLSVECPPTVFQAHHTSPLRSAAWPGALQDPAPTDRAVPAAAAAVAAAVPVTLAVAAAAVAPAAAAAVPVTLAASAAAGVAVAIGCWRVFGERARLLRLGCAIGWEPRLARHALHRSAPAGSLASRDRGCCRADTETPAGKATSAPKPLDFFVFVVGSTDKQTDDSGCSADSG